MTLTVEERAGRLIDALFGERLHRAGSVPGLRTALIHQFSVIIDDVGERGLHQIEQSRAGASDQIPDAFLADEEAIETHLQILAGQVRSALAVQGDILANPRAFESALSARLMPSSRWALLLEASRTARPRTRHEDLVWSLNPVPWAEDPSAWPARGMATAEGKREVEGGPSQVPMCYERPHMGWRQLGLFEIQQTPAMKYPRAPVRQLLLSSGVELYDATPATELPFGDGVPLVWVAPLPDAVRGSMAETKARLGTADIQFSAISRYDTLRGAPSRQRGLGLHPFPLTPHLDIVRFLDLRPEPRPRRNVLVDADGAALVGRLWRGFLVHDGHFEPLEPGVVGGDLLLRADLFDRLIEAAGWERVHFGVAVRESVIEPDESR